MNEYAVMPLTDYQNACNAIREKTDTTDLIKSGEMAEKIKSISGGGGGSYEQGFEDGKQAEYYSFWDNYMFAGAGWNDKTFNPPNSLVSFTNATSMFYNSRIGDLAGILDRNGVEFDFSNVDTISAFACYSSITNFPFMDLTKADSLYNVFSYIRTENVTLPIKIRDDGSQNLDRLFYGATGITNLTIEGTIAQNGFNIQWATKLTIESLRSIINALADKTADTSGTVWTVTVGSTNLNKLTADDLNEIEAKGWVFV